MLSDDIGEKYNFDTNVVTGEFLQGVFDLKTIPKYLISEKGRKIVPINKEYLQSGETYVLKHSGEKFALDTSGSGYKYERRLAERNGTTTTTTTSTTSDSKLLQFYNFQ